MDAADRREAAAEVMAAREPPSTITGRARRTAPRCWARPCTGSTPRTRSADDECRMSALSERPASPTVGQAIPHESAALHVTGEALYTDDLVMRTRDVLHA